MLKQLGDVRPDERRGVAAAFLTLLGILAAHTLLETARDALFLARLPASQLPWMYLAIAAVAFAASRVPLPQLDRLPPTRVLVLCLLACSAITAALWAVGPTRHVAFLYVLYIWSGLFGTLAAVQFWLVLSGIYTVTQAKRLYRLIGTGSVLGAIAGAGIGGIIAFHLPARHLLVASALLTLASALPALLLPRAAQTSSRESDAARAGVSMSSALALARHPYVRALAGLVLFSTIALTLADYIFKSTVALTIPAESLGAFFALFYGLLNVLALLVQLFLVGFVLSRVGVHRALWLLPVLLALGGLGFLVSGGLAAALWLKTTDGALRYSLHRTAIELLYLPLPDAIRTRVKPFIDSAGQRGGQALASILILAPVAFLPRPAFLALSLCILSVLWVLTAKDLKQNYLDLFRAALREGSIATRADLPELDLGSLEAIFAALNSPDDNEVIAAMDLLAAQNKARLIPALVLYHPSRPVVVRAFELFVAAKREDFLPIADRLLGHADAELRAEALRARSRIRPDEALLRKASRDPSPLVRAAAAVGLVSGGWISDEAQTVIDQLLESQSREAGRALARAIRSQPNPLFERALLDLSEAPESEVLVEVAGAMAAMPSESFLPALLPLLGQREVRAAARAAFLAHGDAALEFLDRALLDYELPQELRRHLPRTISPFPPEKGAPILLRHLLAEPDGMVRFKIIRGLNRIRADNPSLALDDRTIREAIASTLQGAFRLVEWQHVLERGAAADAKRRSPGFELLTTLLQDKRIHALERLFRLLALQFPKEDVRGIYRGFASPLPKIRASSRELLENLLLAPLREAVIALADESANERILARAGSYYLVRALEYEELLGVMLETGSESLRCLAAHHVAELGLTSFRPRLEALRPVETGFFVSRVLERALAMLGAAPDPGLSHA